MQVVIVQLLNKEKMKGKCKVLKAGLSSRFILYSLNCSFTCLHSLLCWSFSRRASPLSNIRWESYFISTAGGAHTQGFGVSRNPPSALSFRPSTAQCWIIPGLSTFVFSINHLKKDKKAIGKISSYTTKNSIAPHYTGEHSSSQGKHLPPDLCECRVQ